MPPKTKRRVIDSDSESDGEEDYYSNLVQRRGVDIDDSVLGRQATTSRTSFTPKVDDDVSLDEDEVEDLDKSATFEEELKMQVRRAEKERKRKLDQELQRITNKGRVSEAELGERPRNINYLQSYEESLVICSEINQLVQNLPNSKNKKKPAEKEPQPIQTVLLNVVFRDEEEKQQRKSIDWQTEKRFLDLFKQFADDYGCSVKGMRLMFEGNSHNAWKTPADIGMTAGDTYNVEVVMVGENTVTKPTIKFQLKNERPLMMAFARDTTFAEIKTMLREKGLNFTRIVFDGEAVLDNETPHSVGIEHEDCVDLM